MPRRYSYPENLLSALHLNEETQRTIFYDALTDDQRKGLEALHLPAKCYNPLSRNDVKTVREVLIFLCSSAQIRNFGALSAVAVREHLTRENLLPAGGALPCCNAKAPCLDLEVEVFRVLNTHS